MNFPLRDPIPGTVLEVYLLDEMADELGEEEGTNDKEELGSTKSEVE